MKVHYCNVTGRISVPETAVDSRQITHKIWKKNATILYLKYKWCELEIHLSLLEKKNKNKKQTYFQVLPTTKS